MLTSNLEIIGILCIFAGSSALASGIFRNWTANEYYIQYKNQKPWYKFWGFLFGIKNYNDALNQFLFTGEKHKDDKRRDASAPVRGIIWTFLGSVILIIVTLIE